MAQIFKTANGDPMDVYIYSRKEHPPAHCHIFYEGEEVIVFLSPVAVRKASLNLNDWELQKVLDFVQAHQEMLIKAWSEITGLALDENGKEDA
jgi:hypothetical protein